MSTLRQALGNAGRTENNAASFKSTTDPLLDFYYHAAALRSALRLDQIPRLFSAAYQQDKVLAIAAAFYLRDIRQGAGEREAFRLILEWLASNDPKMIGRIMPYILTDMARYDDLLIFATHPELERTIVPMVRRILIDDWAHMQSGERVTLLAKWMPSENASSKASLDMARWWITRFSSLTYKLLLDVLPHSRIKGKEWRYRQVMRRLREYIDVVESKMSQDRWAQIDYERVPSQAMRIYRKAFRTHDGERFQKYLDQVKTGEKKINAGAMFPYDIIQALMQHPSDESLEVQWDALPDFINGEDAAIVVDTSGSMSYNGAMPLYVALSLGLYAAQRNRGQFRDAVITFSEHPELVELPRHLPLRERLNLLRGASAGLNTNFQAVLDLVLSNAVRNKVPQEGMPKKIFVISDMQFDKADGSVTPPYAYGRRAKLSEPTNFEAARAKFQQAGYSMPTFIFWNVRSNPDESPVAAREEDVFLVSGISPSVFKSALQASVTTPQDLMLEVLNGPRYAGIIKLLRTVDELGL